MAIEKRYEIKIFNPDGTNKFTINPNDILSKISFTENINGWQGQLNLVLNKNFNNDDILNHDFIKVFVFDDNFPNGKNVYTWTVENISRVFTATTNQIEYTIRWLWSLLTRIFYNVSSSFVFTVNQDPWQTVKDMIAYFNTKYPWVWLNDGGVTNFGSSINLWFDFTKISNAINQLNEATGFYWFIDADWTVTFKQNPVTSTHKFTAWDDLQEIVIREDTFDLRNKIILDFDWWISIDEDTTSQTSFWLREEQQDKNEIKDQSSADTSAATFIAENKDPKIRTPVTINNGFARENLKPWDTIKVLNLDFIITNKQIKKINYSRDTSKLEVDDFDSIATVF